MVTGSKSAEELPMLPIRSISIKFLHFRTARLLGAGENKGFKEEKLTSAAAAMRKMTFSRRGGAVSVLFGERLWDCCHCGCC